MKKIDTWLGIQRYINEASEAVATLPRPSRGDIEVIARMRRLHEREPRRRHVFKSRIRMRRELLKKII